MSETTLCLPCALALRPPVTAPPHHCPGQVRLVSGTGQVRIVLCGCRICWPGRSADPSGPEPTNPSTPKPTEPSGPKPTDGSGRPSADLPGEPLDDLGVRQEPEGGAG
ncbi:hypothetical protein [Plantactinospora sp. KLBMP9567]|uniref:hypothetical protein n=1 Tax=Plantactinospora sp. KLBMP9567 TaxID=3085900 RepID=UPI0029820955|nr:hypothetical protein [Plantactinospora sp. KLBMP9567]MDW5328456.1 hypothetical protein [Plantactinospora sp. KLBMP9567]